MDIKKHFKNVIKIKKSPHSIALGFALGTFLAMLPTLGFGPVIGVMILIFFTKISKLAMFGAFLIWNPFVMIPFHLFSYKLGSIILGQTGTLKFQFSLAYAIELLSLRFIIGNLITSTVISIACYFIVKIIAVRYQKNEKSSKKIIR